MEEWKVVSLLVCTFGLLRELRPSEPYVTEFLAGPWRNVTKEELNRDVYPVSTYSNLALLVVVFLVTDYVRYKPVVILSGLSGISIYAILLWTESVEWLQASQFLYALYMATEVAYYTYMFAKVDKDKYRQVASYSRSAALFGRFISGTSAQLLILFDVLDFRQLNYITFTTQILATIWALFLPPVSKSIYFHRVEEESTATDSAKAPVHSTEENVFSLMWEHAKSAYTQRSVVAWSVWYACSTAGYYQVQNYIQILWMEVEPGGKNMYNGLIKAIITILASGAALLAGLWKLKNQNLYDIFPIFAAIFQAVSILISSFATNIWICYTGYICLSVTYHYMITIASFLIAKNLKFANCFGLIFGFNTMIALAIQSLFNLIVISKNGLGLNIRNQYKVYAMYFLITSLAAFVIWIVYYFKRRRNTVDKKDETAEEPMMV